MQRQPSSNLANVLLTTVNNNNEIISSINTIVNLSNLKKLINNSGAKHKEKS